MEQITELDNLKLAFYKAKKSKTISFEVKNYQARLSHNLETLRNSLNTGCVEVGNYRLFTIYEPKERKICAASFPERVLHHALMNICHPVFEKQLISTTYATRLGKGQYAALKRAKLAVKKYDYVAKLDFRKFFESIQHHVLKGLLNHIFKDKCLLSIFDQIIDSYNSDVGCGIPIGNLTSQYFANYYLSSLDHFIKEQLRVPEYIRYMDDMLLFADNKETLKNYVAQLSTYAKVHLLLTLKPVVFSNTTKGVVFLGYKLSKHKILLSQRSKRRFKHKMTEFLDKCEQGAISQQSFVRHSASLLAFVNKAYTKRLRKKIIQNR